MTKVNSIREFNRFQPSVGFNKKTSNLFCNADQNDQSLYEMQHTGLKWVNQFHTNVTFNSFMTRAAVLERRVNGTLMQI